MSPSFESLPDRARAEKALTTFKMLRISDVPGRPTFGEVAEQWVLDFVASVFGAHDPKTGRQIAREVLLLVAKKIPKARWRQGSW
jgi:phage terminase large subunit-like protein